MIRKLWALGAAVPKLCALGLVCGPIPLFMGTVIVPRAHHFVRNKGNGTGNDNGD